MQSIVTENKKETADFTGTRRHQERKEEHIMTSTAHPHGLTPSGLHPSPTVSLLSNSTLTMGTSFKPHKPVKYISKIKQYAYVRILHLKVIHETEETRIQILPESQANMVAFL